MRRRRACPGIPFGLIMFSQVTRTLIVPLALPVSLTAGGQMAMAAEGNEEGTDPPVHSIEPADLPKPQQLEPLIIRDDACSIALPITEPGPGPLGCAFGNTAVGMNYSFRQEAEGHKIVIRALAARQSDGALSLDRLMFDQNPGMAEESSLTGFVADIDLFDGRIQLDSTWAWSNRWLSQQAASTLFLDRMQRGRGTAQSHKITVVPIDRSGLRWSLTADYARADDDYFTGRLSSKLQISAFAGSRFGIASSLSVDKWRLKASVARQNSLFARTETRKLKVSRGGISVNIADQFSETSPTVDYPYLPLAQSAKKSVGLEFDLNTILPTLAIDSSFPAILIPKYSTITFEERSTSLIEIGLEYRRRSFDIMGMWDSELGDTFVNYRVDRKRPLVGASRPSDDAMLYVSHSVRRGNWRFGLDTTTTSSRSGAEFSDSMSLGGSVRYSRSKGPDFQLRVGRDNSAYDLGPGAISSRDTGLQISAMLDMTQWLRNRFERDDMHLTFEYRHRMRENQFDFELLEGLIESERDRLARHGFLMSFGMKLP